MISLENRIQALIDQRTNPRLSAQAIASLDREIEQAEHALAHFRAALRNNNCSEAGMIRPMVLTSDRQPLVRVSHFWLRFIFRVPEAQA